MARPTSLSKRRSISMKSTTVMLPSLLVSDHVMPGRTTTRTARRRRAWTWALFGSFWTHAALLGTMVALGERGLPRAAEPVVVELTAPPPEAPADPRLLEPASDTLPDPPLPARDELPRAVILGTADA